MAIRLGLQINNFSYGTGVADLFPTVIAHGMFSAAAVLANIEGQLPDAVKYSVRFAKPVVLPARAGLYVDRTADGWDLTLRHLTKGHPHLSGSVTPA